MTPERWRQIEKLLNAALELDPGQRAAFLDAACTGELIAPLARIQSLGLDQAARVKAGLGDGSQVLLDTYTCHIDWFGKTRKVEIVASTGSFPLIGVGLLEDHELNIHYPNRTVQLG